MRHSRAGGNIAPRNKAAVMHAAVIRAAALSRQDSLSIGSSGYGETELPSFPLATPRRTLFHPPAHRWLRNRLPKTRLSAASAGCVPISKKCFRFERTARVREPKCFFQPGETLSRRSGKRCCQQILLNGIPIGFWCFSRGNGRFAAHASEFPFADEWLPVAQYPRGLGDARHGASV